MRQNLSEVFRMRFKTKEKVFQRNLNRGNKYMSTGVKCIYYLDNEKRFTDLPHERNIK